jgi:galactokinase
MSQLHEAFSRRFGAAPPAEVRAPGRVNLIGEHTDYNDGFVLPMAIDREVRIALAPRDDQVVRVHALDLGESASLELGELSRGDGWSEYVKGVAWVLQGEGHSLRGWDGVITGSVPLGAGLSSSAALELAVARAFAVSSGFAWDGARVALACQQAENQWVGVNCGIMDQLISACGRDGHALLIDCRTLQLEAVPLPAGHAVVVLDTMTRRSLVDSAYNERRGQCQAAARHFAVRALRDVSLEQWEARQGELAELPRRRARHVISENARTLATAQAMRAGSAAELGKLMDQSHASLQQDFEVSSPALDAMVACARRHAACRGARMTGAGFGGCAVALVQAGAVESFQQAVADGYREATGRAGKVYVCRPTAGAARVL